MIKQTKTFVKFSKWNKVWLQICPTPNSSAYKRLKFQYSSLIVLASKNFFCKEAVNLLNILSTVYIRKHILNPIHYNQSVCTLFEIYLGTSLVGYGFAGYIIPFLHKTWSFYLWASEVNCWLFEVYCLFTVNEQTWKTQIGCMWL